MLQLSEFEELTEREKRGAMLHSTFIAERPQDGIVIKLCSLSNFFVEVFCCPERKLTLGYYAFRAEKLPEVYLEACDLNVN